MKQCAKCQGEVNDYMDFCDACFRLYDRDGLIDWINEGGNLCKELNKMAEEKGEFWRFLEIPSGIGKTSLEEFEKKKDKDRRVSGFYTRFN